MRVAARALTLIEIVMALGLLAVIMLAFGVLASSSVNASTDSRPNLIAQEAASRLVEIMRSGKIAADNPPAGNSIFEAYFDSYAYKVTLGGVQYAAPDLTVPASFAGPYNDPFAALAVAYRNGTMRRPSDAPNRPLRVRFLDENDYQAMWGLPALVDLDFSGGATTGVTTAYRAYPVYVEIRWGPPSGGPDRVHQLKALLSPATALDPTR